MKEKTWSVSGKKLLSSRNIFLVFLALLAPFAVMALDVMILDGESISHMYIALPLDDEPLLGQLLLAFYRMWPSFFILSFLSASFRSKCTLFSTFILIVYPLVFVSYIVAAMAIYNVYP